MGDVYVVGVSMTPFGRFFDKSVKQLTHESVCAALNDAALDKESVGAAYFSNTTQGLLEGQHLVPGEMALRDMGFEGIPMMNVENACASASSALKPVWRFSWMGCRPSTGTGSFTSGAPGGAAGRA